MIEVSKVGKVVKYLPIIILLSGVIIKLILFFSSNLIYTYDEIIVAEISKQETFQLLDTVKAEPHPPGFYFLLKLINTDDVLTTRIFLTSINLLIVLSGLVYAYRKRLVSQYSLSLGLALFFSSFNFLFLGSSVKQDSISFPVYLLTIFLALVIVRSKGKDVSKELIAINLLTVLLLFIGYLYYFQSLIILLLLTIYTRKDKLSIKLFLTQIFILIAYLSFYGFEQAVLNLERFSWIQESYNSFLTSLSSHLTGTNKVEPSEFHLFIFIGLVIVALLNRGKKFDKTIYKTMVIFAGVYILLAYLLYLYVRARYVLVIFFLLSILAGWGISLLYQKLDGYLGRINLLTIPAILAFFYLPSLLVYRNSIKLIAYERSEEVAEALSFVKEEKAGYLTDHPLLPYITELGFGLRENIVALNVAYPKLFVKRTGVDRSLLMADGSYKDFSFQEIGELLSETELKNFIYLMVFQINKAYYDPDRTVLFVLSRSCEINEVIPIANNLILFVFRECRFD